MAYLSKELNLVQKTRLKKLNSFGIEASCEQLVSFHSEAEISSWLALNNNQSERFFVLGGGSNLLLIGHVPYILLQANIQGVEYQEQGDDVLVKAGAGVNWHQLVMQTLDKGYCGLENLSLIPGNVGAAPIQNIGAYGVELKDLFVELEAIELATGDKLVFAHQECDFAYRHSIFKGALKGQYIITSVSLKLSKIPKLKLDYGPIRNELSHLSDSGITPKAVSEAVIKIRSSKLPDPEELGNAGSFFKNPIVSASSYQQLKQQFPELVAFEIADGRYKLAAGWLIDQAGLKGYRLGDAGVHKKQALVLVNYGDASGKDILSLARFVAKTIDEKFGVTIEPEVWILGEASW
ncbi:UDP-N-acetylmuramate dehydrogenase [Kangiella sp. TOML190]|uniref:UDP-N-acetylmuramate dehydrogenase n=1 Tax=Kangiella sp. TOML190 TaxID=2931351 RepID=UPI0025595DDB|nr:UDP-N-acetylmuramate dehydrogenase [Kangiella sp. TOML190]